MEHSEYIKLQAQLQDHFDGRYRKIDDCDDIVEALDKKVTKDDVRLAIIEQQNKLLLWIAATEAAGFITMLIKMIFGG